MFRFALTLLLLALASAGCEFPTIDLSGPFEPTPSPASDALLLGDWTGYFTDGSESVAMRLTIRSTYQVVVQPGVRVRGEWWSSTDSSSGTLFGAFDASSLSLELDAVGCYGKVTTKVADNRMQGTYTGGNSCPRPMKSGTIDLTRTCVGPAC